jgi:hypothetical protein
MVRHIVMLTMRETGTPGGKAGQLSITNISK